MASVTPNTPSLLRDETGEYVWEKNARKLRIWFRICWISVVFALATVAPVGESLRALFSTGFFVAVVTAIGCIVYAYRVQTTLKRHKLARTDPAFIVIAGVLALLPTALIASPAVLSNARKAARSVEEGLAPPRHT